MKIVLLVGLVLALAGCTARDAERKLICQVHCIDCKEVRHECSGEGITSETEIQEVHK